MAFNLMNGWWNWGKERDREFLACDTYQSKETSVNTGIIRTKTRTKKKLSSDKKKKSMTKELLIFRNGNA